jgi:hypothetical protein
MLCRDIAFGDRSTMITSQIPVDLGGHVPGKFIRIREGDEFEMAPMMTRMHRASSSRGASR